MAIFDIEKDELLRLSDTQLEELIARLAEAEVAIHGHSVTNGAKLIHPSG
ncbi:hypothetical protein [Pantoea dispersa]|nr:hypothetical protein [Pantoea dispersa]MBS0898564.1 hypothetical protein [Pantoea dispersa]